MAVISPRLDGLQTAEPPEGKNVIYCEATQTLQGKLKRQKHEIKTNTGELQTKENEG